MIIHQISNGPEVDYLVECPDCGWCSLPYVDRAAAAAGACLACAERQRGEDNRRRYLPRLVCAWCRTTLRPGNAALPASHGLCEMCEEAQLVIMRAEFGDEARR